MKIILNFLFLSFNLSPNCILRAPFATTQHDEMTCLTEGFIQGKMLTILKYR